ncbi:LOW QUALITY PROTEIN: hypothetical protein ACHAWF_005931, partial [Thalassiosira exigua]
VQKQVQRYHLKFPGVLGFDVTFGTNVERCPLFRGSLKTSNNNNVPAINAYIPSDQRWVFECSDENTRCTIRSRCAACGNFISQLGVGGSTIYGNARNRLCKWHTVHKGYKEKAAPYIENEVQERDSLAKTFSYLASCGNERKVNANLVVFIIHFVKNSFEPLLGLLCRRHFNDIYCSNRSSLKRDPTGPQANAKLASSATAILNHTKRWIDKQEKEAMKRFICIVLPKRDDSVCALARASSSEHIVGHKSKLAVEQFKHSRCE